MITSMIYFYKNGRLGPPKNTLKARQNDKNVNEKFSYSISSEYRTVNNILYCICC